MGFILLERALAMLAAFDLVESSAKDVQTVHDLGHEFHNDLINFIHLDLPKILVVLLIAFILQRIVIFFVKRLHKAAERQVGNSQRAAQMRTLASILRATAYTVIAFVAMLQILPIFNIDLKPLLASAGVVGLGISFGAQSIFKDMLNGIFIFVEDQFNVGDVVLVAGLKGTVEDMTLRATRVRDGNGTLYFIPNSQIATVSNLSREYAVASLPVSVDSSADPDRVIAVLQRVAEDVRRDKAFAQVVIADPTVLGVDKINGHEVIYPINLRVRINQQDPVLRALRKRVLETFKKEGIPLGISNSVILSRGADPTAPPAEATMPGQ